MNGNNGMYENNPITPISEEHVVERAESTNTFENREQANTALSHEQLQDHKDAASHDAVSAGPLTWLRAEDVDEFHSRWNAIQLEFMNEPRTSVEQAGKLVGDAYKRIEQAISAEITTQNGRWNHADTSTEDLRVSLRTYRKLLDRLLAL